MSNVRYSLVMRKPGASTAPKVLSINSQPSTLPANDYALNGDRGAANA